MGRTSPVLFFSFVLLTYSAWARGGTWVPLQQPLPWLGLLVLSAALAPSPEGRRAGIASALGEIRQRLLRLSRDPIVYLGLAFLALLWVQWWNAGRVRVFDISMQKWVFSGPPNPHLPSAVTRAEAAEMLRWFFPAWCLLAAIRLCTITPLQARRFLLVLTFNAGALSLFGLAQFLSGAAGVYWTQPQNAHFFAFFGYANHAAAFFLLLFAVASALCARDTVRAVRWESFSRIRLISAGAAALLCFGGAHLSLSRTGVTFAWGLLVAALTYTSVRIWTRLSPIQRTNAVVAIVVSCSIGVLAVAGPARRAFLDSRGESRTSPLFEQAAGRMARVKPALQMWPKAPWFGLGGWGYRYFVADYRLPAYWETVGEGAANVHCDPLQFLVEFGVLGTAVMAAVAFLLAHRLHLAINRGGELVVVGTLGVAAVALHSLFDLPFRCPTVLYHWLCVSAMLPMTLPGVPARSGSRERKQT